MFKRIAVILDPALDCRAVFAACKYLAKQSETVLLAVPCVIIEKKIKDRDDRRMRSHLNAHAHKIREFVRLCATARMDYEIASSTPLSLKEAISASQSADFLVLARPGDLKSSHKQFTRNLRRLFIQSGCPVLLAAGSASPMKNILVAWDGSPESLRTVKMHLQLFHSLKLHYVFLLCGEDSVAAQTQLHTASEYISHHAVSAETLALAGKPSDVLAAAYIRLKARQLLVGLHRRNMYNKKKFGKISRALLNNEALALFFYD